MTDILLHPIEKHVAHIELNRPEKLNALTLDMFDLLPSAINELESDKRVRAAVISGSGRAFCAGMDMENFAKPQLLETKFNNPAREFPNFFQRPAMSLRNARFPVIAAISGPCLGGGLQIALGADIRFCAPNAVFSVMEIKWGMIPDMSASQTLRELVGIDVAKELTFTGRKVAAEEARELGLVTRIVDDPILEAKQLASEISDKNPDAVEGAKELFHKTWGSQGGLETEERIQRQIVFQPRQIEAAMATLEGRKAKF